MAAHRKAGRLSVKERFAQTLCFVSFLWQRFIAAGHAQLQCWPLQSFGQQLHTRKPANQEDKKQEIGTSRKSILTLADTRERLSLRLVEGDGQNSSCCFSHKRSVSPHFEATNGRFYVI